MPASGSKWNTSRCSQYSNSVHSAYPDIARPTIAATLTCARLQAAITAITGTNNSSGTAGCTREKKSSRRDSNIGGDALSTSERRLPLPVRRFTTSSVSRRVHQRGSRLAGRLGSSDWLVRVRRSVRLDRRARRPGRSCPARRGCRASA